VTYIAAADFSATLQQ